MTEKNQKTAFWEDELPDEIKESIRLCTINAHIKNFEKTQDPFCLASICNELTLDARESNRLGLSVIKDHLQTRAKKKGIRYTVDKDAILNIWSDLKLTKMTDAAKRRLIAEKFSYYSEDAIRKIIEQGKI